MKVISSTGKFSSTIASAIITEEKVCVMLFTKHNTRKNKSGGATKKYKSLRPVKKS